MQAKVKQNYRYKTLVAFGIEFIKGELREVPAEREAEAKRHPSLEIVELVTQPIEKEYHEPKRTRK